jgi:hypothetical protein
MSSNSLLQKQQNGTTCCDLFFTGFVSLHPPSIDLGKFSIICWLFDIYIINWSGRAVGVLKRFTLHNILKFPFKLIPDSTNFTDITYSIKTFYFVFHTRYLVVINWLPSDGSLGTSRELPLPGSVNSTSAVLSKEGQLTTTLTS